ncbi:transglycosylase domain-containing protein [Desulfosediminicola ganghwensis]|uniref:transglycosylase domain-containing protein n=1 Tax=Desulfosediminicola ganghwensis TaxID=2569540 RepID=UPI0010ACC231|nr:transglycosylase domain-containing protein [Desulfosediminicola ganghwensis]
MLKKLFYFFLFVCFAAVATASGGLYYYIVLEPGTEIDENNIGSILGKESPVFYNDNQTKLGVFFDEAHRQYVRYGEIPEDFVNALVAAEDNRFFEHFGFDVFGITRAVIRNVQAGRIVQGGSTLTQQTAKNLFKRTERSYKAKLKELLFALRLEYRYPKEKIFEFYANQFYVSGNGHGLGVAARYYFDKKPSELTLVECAFIAGSVKRPNYYNPFIKKTRESAELAEQRARGRLKYVLDKMLELEMIGLGKYREALASNIGFNQGQVGYSLDYVMEMVKDAVTTQEITESLEKHDIDNVATSGIRIITTVDKDIQAKTLYALRHDLSRLDTLLRGYERDEVQQEYSEMTYTGDNRLDVGSFLFGTVSSVTVTGGQILAVVDFGRKLGAGTLDTKGFEHLVDPRVKWQKNIWAKPAKADTEKLAGQIQPGDKIWVSVRDVNEVGDVLLDLEKYPKVQGATMVMKDGMIRAMAGGTENRFYNRAVYAKRTMGSSLKPFVFAAALQLGWNSSDLLQNSRDVFVYHNQPYFPRPDHQSPHEWVSMSWAGVKSENLASVWLLANLCEQLNPIQFKTVADHLGLTPKVVNGEQEPYRTYRNRIRDRYGIVVNQDVLREAAYNAALRNSEADFMFENMIEEYKYFNSLHYGLNFDNFTEQLNASLKDRSKLKNYEIEELQLRKKILSKTFLKFEELRSQLHNYTDRLEDPLGLMRPDLLGDDLNSGELFFDFNLGRYVFMPRKLVHGDLRVINRRNLQQQLFVSTEVERKQFWGNILLYGEVSVESFDMLSRQMDFEYRRLQRELPYSFEVLSEVKDFRINVGLRYLIDLARQMGVKSDLQPVLSFALGSNVMSLLETTRMYETMVTGKLTTYGEHPQGSDNDSLLIIDRIESSDGRLLYQPERHVTPVLGEKSRIAVNNILENVMKFGTGRRADKAVKIAAADGSGAGNLTVPVPLMGKTGTANRYTNASFFGYLPGLGQSGTYMVPEKGYAVGAYVGFDDNSDMRKSTIRITGAAGALPSWVDIVNTIIQERSYIESFDPVDLSFNGLQLKYNNLGQLNMAVKGDGGGVIGQPASTVSELSRYKPSILTFGQVSESGFIPERTFEPFWQVGEGLLFSVSDELVNAFEP